MPTSIAFSSPRARRALQMTLVAGGVLAGLGLAVPSQAASVYIGLGDSITFGETDLSYVPSNGDRGYVAAVADSIAARNGGARPTVFNFAIDGETASSFFSGSGRTPPVVGRTDVPLALQNSNYSAANLLPQSQLFAATVAAQQALGNTVDTVTISLGFNELAALAALPTNAALAQIPLTLANYSSQYGAVLSQIRGLLPNASLSVLGYFNPFPANPSSPAAPIFNAAGVQLNSFIAKLASQYNATFVDTATPFIGREALYTYQDEMPAGSSIGGSFGGVLPIGNVHPNALGYSVIAAQVSAVPEPGTWALMAAGLAVLPLLAQRTRRRAAAAAPA